MAGETVIETRALSKTIAISVGQVRALKKRSTWRSNKRDFSACSVQRLGQDDDH